MLKSIKNLLIIVVILAIIFVGWKIYSKFQAKQDAYEDAELRANKYKVELVNTKYQDSILQLTQSNLLDLTESQRDTLANRLKIMGVKLKNAQSYTKTTTETRIEKHLIHDTITNTEYYTDPYTLIQLDSLKNIHINIKDTLYQITSRKVVKGKEYYQIRAKNTNPDIHITNLSSVTIPVTKEKSRWGISVYGGYGVSIDQDHKFTKPTAQIGVGISFNLIRFNRKK